MESDGLAAGILYSFDLVALQWITYTPEGTFPVVSDGKQYAAMIQQQGGDQALQQWRQLEDKLRPLQQGAALFPAAALRGDLGEPAGCCFPQRLSTAKDNVNPR